MEAKTEVPPPSKGDPEPSEIPSVAAIYALLGDRAPAITYVPQWGSWVRKGDIPTSQFPTLQAYLDEFPYHVEVADAYVVVTDPGFGNGAIEWIMRRFKLASGGAVVALTETDAHHESSECKIWVGQWHVDDWLDLTDIALPEISRSDFFGQSADNHILEDYELVSLQYILPREGNVLQVHAMPNTAFECHEGTVVHEDLGPGDAEKICRAWDSFLAQPIECTWDPTTGKFIRNR